MASHLPIVPTRPEINGKGASDGMASKSMGSLTLSAVVDDPDATQRVRLVVYYSGDDWKTQHSVHGTGWEKQRNGKGVRDSVRLNGLSVNTLYKTKLFSQARDSRAPYPLSANYNGLTFWTNRGPTAELVAPAQNQEINEDEDFLFDWKFVDPDSGDDQSSYQIQYRPTTTSTWTTVSPTSAKDGAVTFRFWPKNTLVSNTHYKWRVRVRDDHTLWGEWSLEQSFFLRGIYSPPLLVSPLGGIGKAVVVTDPVIFTWRFRDPTPSDKQYQADIRWRAVDAGGGAHGITQGGQITGDEGWFMLSGSGDIPGSTNQWSVPPGYFTPAIVYEWQVRTYDDPNFLVPSGWSSSGSFTATGTPGAAATPAVVPDNPEIQGTLGCGHHRVFIYDRGAQVLRGEITPVSSVTWGRKRDDIANSIVTTNGFGADCCELLGGLRSWMHEVVIYRDAERVFEGPITRITYTSNNVEIEAKDVMAYVYRRVMREGYDDVYRRIDLTPLTPPQALPSTGGGPYLITGNMTVVRRAAQITLNALAYHDPNVLPYLTIIDNAGDAKNSRVVSDYSRTAWEEIDDLAATAGLDYVTVGRRIMYWDTHRAIGRLPEMRDGDFSDPVIVTEYGMQTSNYFAVTNNSGQWGARYPLGLTDATWFQAYGPVEMVSSAYGEQEGDDDTASSEVLTPGKVAALTATYEQQAARSIAARWPTPVVVRVPDNSTLNPDLNLGINQLVPGVWVPLRATATCRNVSQWQKLDEVNVSEAEGVEQIQVTMSPAPNGGNDDPDAGGDDGGDA